MGKKADAIQHLLDAYAAIIEARTRAPRKLQPLIDRAFINVRHALGNMGFAHGQSGGGSEYAPFEQFLPGDIKDVGTTITSASNVIDPQHSPFAGQHVLRMEQLQGTPRPFGAQSDLSPLTTSGLDPATKSTVLPTMGGGARRRTAVKAKRVRK